ncbi:MAG: hypothetical protein OEY00_08130 [Gammaproteobacteria bacterium]|nr:hypothetical protein [Gammaproteobacteria bacterium]
MLRNTLLLSVISSSLLFTACGGGDDGPSGSGLTLATQYNGIDSIDNYTRYSLNEFGKRDLAINYTERGLDAEWYTDDDKALTYRTYQYDAQQRLTQINYYSPGLDLELFTDDDEMYRYRKTIFADDGLSSQTILYGTSGLDRIWENSDDTILSYTNTEYDTNGNQLSIAAYYSGPDADWFTNDDEMSYIYESRNYDQHNNLTRITIRYGEGLDNTPFTNDDIGHYYQLSYNENNVLMKMIEYGSAGGDGLWHTSDDVRSGFERSYINLDENGNPSRVVKGIKFDNQDWDLATHEIHDYSDVEYHPSGFILKRSSYDWPGIDNIWFTPDDSLAQVLEYTLY